jgi:Zn-dependent M28 family amino/carboxypeptidase
MPRRALAATLAATLLTLGAGAARARERALPPVDLAALEGHLAFLADDRLEGRDTGSTGYEIAALYAASRFRQYGLEPGVAGSFEQRIRFATATVAGSSLAVVPAAGERRPLEPLTDYVLHPSVVHARVELTAPLVFAGFGVEAPELGRRDYTGLDVAGKIAVVLSGAPDAFPANQRAHHGSRRTQAEVAAARGAVGLVVVRTRRDAQRVPWARVAAHAGHPVLRFRHPDGALQDAFEGLRFGAMLSERGAETLLAAAGVELDALLDAAAKGEATPRPLGIELALSLESRLGETTSPNVVARLPGAGALAAEHVVATAHLDHVGVGQAVDGDTIYNGYYDNAMGSAILLEVARRLAAAPAGRARRSIVFALVTGEEKGLLGADYYAHHPTVPAESLVADVNFDMPLLLAPLADLVAFGAEHSTLGALAERAARAHGFTLTPDPFPEESIFVRSDQYPFVRRGIPAIFLSAGGGTRGDGDAQMRATRDFLARHYHRPSDEAGLGVDRGSLAGFTAAATELVRLIADAPERPRWHPGDYFGTTFGRGASAAAAR